MEVLAQRWQTGHSAGFREVVPRNEGVSEGGGQGGLGGEDRQCGVRRGARWRRVVHIRPGFATSRSELSGSTQPFTTLRDSGQGSGQGAAGGGGGFSVLSCWGLGWENGRRLESPGA